MISRHSLAEDYYYSSFIVNIVTADHLTTQGANAPTAMGLTTFSWGFIPNMVQL